MYSAVLEKLKMSQPIRGQGGLLVFWISLNNTNLVEGVRSCILSSFSEFCLVVSEEKSKCFSQSEARAAILVFQLAQKTQTWLKKLRSLFLSSFIDSVQRFQRS